MSIKLLSCYLPLDICRLTNSYLEPIVDYQFISTIISDNKMFDIRTPLLKYTITYGTDCYYTDLYGIIKKTNQTTVKLLHGYVWAFGICQVDNRRIFVIREPNYITTYDMQFNRLFKMPFANSSFLLVNGDCIYCLEHRQLEPNIKFTLLVKYHCDKNGTIHKLNQIHVANFTKLLTANDHFIFARVGNKCIQYDTNLKVNQRLNVGQSMHNGVIKENNLIIYTNEKQLTIDIYNRMQIINQRPLNYRLL